MSCHSFLPNTETGGVLLANRVIYKEENEVDVKDSSLTPFFGVQPVLVNPKVSVTIHLSVCMYVHICLYMSHA